MFSTWFSRVEITGCGVNFNHLLYIVIVHMAMFIWKSFSDTQSEIYARVLVRSNVLYIQLESWRVVADRLSLK